jgi:hypothetical protein
LEKEFEKTGFETPTVRTMATEKNGNKEVLTPAEL